MKTAINTIEVHLDILRNNGRVAEVEKNAEEAQRYRGEIREHEIALELLRGLSKIKGGDVVTEGLTFGAALQHLNAGNRVQRAGWNGRFLFLLPVNGSIPDTAIHDPALRRVIANAVRGDAFTALGSIRVATDDKKVLTGWLASQTDMLAEDWRVLPID